MKHLYFANVPTIIRLQEETLRNFLQHAVPNRMCKFQPFPGESPVVHRVFVLLCRQNSISVPQYEKYRLTYTMNCYIWRFQMGKIAKRTGPISYTH